MNRQELPEEFDSAIRALKKEGDNFQMRHKYLKAVEKHKEAISLLPEPLEQWSYIRILWKSIQENYWLNARFNEGKKGGYVEALEYWKKLMQLPHSIGDDHYHFRIGQIHYELEKFEKAKDELMRAYLISGMDRFNGNDKKYFELIKPIVDGQETEITYTADVETYQFE